MERLLKKIKEYGFYLNRVFPYKDQINDSAMGKNGSQKTIFWHMLRSVIMEKFYYKWMRCCEYMEFI